MVKVKTEKQPAKLGRPHRTIDWIQVEQLAGMQCTIKQVAAVMRCDQDTLHAACLRDHGVHFPEWYSERREVGRVSLRQFMFKSAAKGNVPAMIFLAKQTEYLGYSDKVDQTITHSGEVANPSLGESLMQRIHSDPDALRLARELSRKLDKPKDPPTGSGQGDPNV